MAAIAQGINPSTRVTVPLVALHRYRLESSTRFWNQ